MAPASSASRAVLLFLFTYFVVFSLHLNVGDAAGCACDGALPALQVLYDATEGPNWNDPWDLSGSAVSPCTLSGVTCLSLTATEGSISIDLRDRNLVGSIPSSLATLFPNIVVLSLANNSLRGVLPATFSLLGSSIITFDVSYNSDLTGMLPPELQAWTSIQIVALDNCNFYGSIPVGFKAWTQLQSLTFASNRINGSIADEFAAWGSIKRMIGTGNAMTGTVPTAVISAWANSLSELSMASNRLTGVLFTTESCSWRSIVTVRLNNNLLSGTLPLCVSNWSATIQIFLIHNNSFSGELPPTLGQWSAIRELDFGSNLFVGSLPPSFSSFLHVASFEAMDCKLTGTLPPQYSGWTTITRFSVSGNQLTGTLPPSYASWGTSINDIRLAQNNFTGTLPEAWGRAFSRLNLLMLTSNHLTGTLPASFAGMRALLVLSLDDNNFYGSLPAEWSALTLVQALGLRNNTALSGPIPSSWSAMSQLLVLAFCFTLVCGKASMFPLLGSTGFACPDPSAMLQFGAKKIDATLIAYVLQLERVPEVACPFTSVPSSNTSTTGPAPTAGKSNTTEARTLPYTSVATSAATAAVWSVVATRGLSVSGVSAPAASVAFLQGAFASSRLRRRCTAGASANTESDPPLSDPLDNPTQIELPHRAGSYAGGAVVGNSALLTAAAILSHLATLLRLWHRGHRTAASTQPSHMLCKILKMILPSDGTQLPASGTGMYSLLVTPTIAGCVVLFMNDTAGSAVYAIGAVGAALWVAPFLWVAWHMHRVPFPFRTTHKLRSVPVVSPAQSQRQHHEEHDDFLHARRELDSVLHHPHHPTVVDVRGGDDGATSECSSRTLTAKSAVIEFLWAPTHTWCIVHTHTERYSRQQLRRFFHCYGAFFEGVRCEWKMLFAVELAIALACGAVQGGADAAGAFGDPSDACAAAEWGSATLAALTGMVLLIHVIFRPCLVRYDELQCVVLTALTVASEAANAVGGDAGEQVGELIALVAAILQATLAVFELLVTRIVLGVSPLQLALPEEFTTGTAAHQLLVPPQASEESAAHRPLQPFSTTHGPAVPRGRGYVTLAQMKNLKGLLKLIARNHNAGEK